MGVDVISLSLGGAPGIAPSFLGGDSVATATLDAISEGIYVVAAAGNDGEDDGDDDVDSPCSEEDVICVGGVGIEGDIWRGSSKGSNDFQLIPPKLSRQDPDKKPELVAPAESVPVLLSTNTGANEPSTATYGTASGTSAATVYVSSDRKKYKGDSLKALNEYGGKVKKISFLLLGDIYLQKKKMELILNGFLICG